MKTFVAHIGRLPGEDRQRIRAHIPDNIWREIETSSALAWLPFETNFVCTHAVASSIGPDRTHDFFKTLIISTSRTPILQSLVISVVSKFERDRTGALYWIAKGFELLFKDSGAWRVLHKTASGGELQVQGLPFLVANDEIWIQSVSSALSALFVIAGVKGKSEVIQIDPATGRVVFRLSTTAA